MKGRLSPSPLHTVYFAAGALSLACLILRAVALLCCFDTEIGYFAADSLLPRAAAALTVLSVAALVLLPALTDSALAPADAPASPLSLCGGILAAALALYLAVSLPSAHVPQFGSTLIYYLSIILMLPTAAFLALPAKPAFFPLRTPCGFAAILGCGTLLSLTYLDSFVAMNAPHKVLLHMALLSIMLFVLFDVRLMLGKDMPRARLAVTSISLLLSTVSGASHVAGFLAGVLPYKWYFHIDLFCLGFGVYIATRAVEQLIAPKTAADTEQTESEETNA